MLAIAFWISFVLASLTVVSAIVKAALEVESDNAAKAETMSFVRMTLTGIFGVTIGQSLVPLGFAWWITAVLSVVLMLTLLVTSQLAASALSSINLSQGASASESTNDSYAKSSSTSDSTSCSTVFTNSD